MSAKSLLACAAFLALSTACTSRNLYVENRLVLERAMTDLKAGESERAAYTLESMLGETDAAEFALQRFFAAYLLTLAHEEASAEGPFLEEPLEPSGRFDAGASGSRRPSRIGHLMAVTYHASRGRSWYPLAGLSPLAVEGERLLPIQLEALGAQNALVYMNLCYLAVHSELNFQDRIEEILAGMSELTDLARCEAVMDRVDLPADLRPWIYRAVFEHQKRRDEPNAYRFAIRARETGKDVPAFGQDLCDRIAYWITDESSYRFVSPANQPFDPALEGCTVTGTPNLMYEALLEQP